jgi:DNA-binding transcriptional ArsR family regulator
MNGQRPLTDLAANLIAERFRVLGQPLRVKLVDRLAFRATTVQELVDELGTTQQNISQHLGILQRAGISPARRRGPACVTKSPTPASSRSSSGPKRASHEPSAPAT